MPDTTAPQSALRWSIPIDDQAHTVPCGTGRILGVECRSDPSAPDHHLDIWVQSTAYTDGYDTTPRRFLVVGTGHHWPWDATHVGLALTPASLTQRPDMTVEVLVPVGRLVWHLLELAA